LSALLVESKRVNGKVRQRHIAYLGGISQSPMRNQSTMRIAGRPSHARARLREYSIDERRRQFWDSVTAAFDKLEGQIDPDERKRFEAIIAKRVPRPTKREIAAAKQSIEQALADINAVLHGKD
jgi:hypothetical protein